MSQKTGLLCFALLGVMFPGNALADDSGVIPTGKSKSDFDLKQYKQFIDFDLSRPKPECQMAEMGIPPRQVEGQLVDHAGNPLADIVVAIVEPIGYSGHCYYDNFDTTDSQGRFLVAGSMANTRLVFRKSGGSIWVVNLESDEKLKRVTWPEPATVSVQVPKEFAVPGQSVTIQTRDYWSGMAVMRQSGELNDEGVAVFEEVIPADYFVTINRTIDVAGEQKRREIAIASFTITAGQQSVVKCAASGGTVVVGKQLASPQVPVGAFAPFVIIERDRLNYIDQSPIADLLNLQDDGTFRSRSLSPGHYSIHVMSKGRQARGRFGSGGDMMLSTWRIEVDGSVDVIDLDSIAKLDPIAKTVENALRGAAMSMGSSAGKMYADQLKQLDDRSQAEKELLRLLADPTYPYPLRRNIPIILQEMTDSSQVVDGLLQALNKPLDVWERVALITALQQSTEMVDEIVVAIAQHLGDSHHIIRGITIRVLGELAVRNPDHASAIAKLLERGLDDRWESTRSTAADYLGRIGVTNALPALLKSRNDPYGPVAVMAAYSAWKISGDPDDVYPTMTKVLHGDGIAGMWEAAYFMKLVAEKHPVPENTQGVLRRVATMAGKPPFKTSYQYEQSRAAKAAQVVLDQIASK